MRPEKARHCTVGEDWLLSQHLFGWPCFRPRLLLDCIVACLSWHQHPSMCALCLVSPRETGQNKQSKQRLWPKVYFASPACVWSFGWGRAEFDPSAISETNQFCCRPFGCSSRHLIATLTRALSQSVRL